jgi:hypothetical protein
MTGKHDSHPSERMTGAPAVAKLAEQAQGFLHELYRALNFDLVQPHAGQTPGLDGVIAYCARQRKALLESRR